MTGRVHKKFGWYRSVCPWDTSLSHNTWITIHRPYFSNDELLAQVSQIPQLINTADSLELRRVHEERAAQRAERAASNSSPAVPELPFE